MGMFNVSYDLIREKNYERLITGIQETVVSWSRPLASTWIVEWNGTALELTNALLKFMDGDDKILVTGVKKGTVAWRGLPKDVVDWINSITVKLAA